MDFNDTQLQVHTILFSVMQPLQLDTKFTTVLYTTVFLPWTTLQSSIRNILSGLHRAPLGWAGTGDHIDAEGLYTSLSVCENLDHSLMSTGGHDGELRIDS